MGMELLSPAGGMAQLKAAVQSGADAVYLGAPEFSARAGAQNFGFDELREAVKYAHVYGVKVHCALNTLIKEHELDSAAETAVKIAECGVDAIIIQDLGLASILRKIIPQMELHASTQMTVTSLEGVRYLEEHGFSRVVLARELSYDEIKTIAKGARAEIEVFVHGAICMCYSGQCLMSSILGGRSGNRGRCAQPCRLPYTVGDKNAYALSPKDMSLISHLDELEKAGVASLKIEGRLKSPEYVSAVTGVYRKYLDNRKPVSGEDMTELKNAFSRSGFTDGYFTNKLGKTMMSHDNPANNSGNEYTESARMRAEGKLVRRIGVHIFASLKMGEPLTVSIYDDDGHCAYGRSDECAEAAINRPMDKERLISQLEKLGETPFYAIDTEIDTDSGITIPIKAINSLRRRLCDELINACSYREGYEINEIPPRKKYEHELKDLYLCAEVMTYEQGMAAIKSGHIKRIYAPNNISARLMGKGVEIVTKASDIFKPEEIVTDNASVSSPAAIRYYGEKAKYGDFRLNIYNSAAASELPMLSCITLSPELNLREIKELTEHFSGETEIIAYGRLPLMIMRNCPLSALGKCQNRKNEHTLRDRRNMEFPIICLSDCKAILLNSQPIFTADIMESIRNTKINCLRLNFTVEKSDVCGKIIDIYHSAISGKPQETPMDNTFTRGHLRRGVI